MPSPYNRISRKQFHRPLPVPDAEEAAELVQVGPRGTGDHHVYVAPPHTGAHPRNQFRSWLPLPGTEAAIPQVATARRRYSQVDHRLPPPPTGRVLQTPRDGAPREGEPLIHQSKFIRLLLPPQPLAVPWRIRRPPSEQRACIRLRNRVHEPPAAFDRPPRGWLSRPRLVKEHPLYTVRRRPVGPDVAVRDHRPAALRRRAPEYELRSTPPRRARNWAFLPPRKPIVRPLRPYLSVPLTPVPIVPRGAMADVHRTMLPPHTGLATRQPLPPSGLQPQISKRRIAKIFEPRALFRTGRRVVPEGVVQTVGLQRIVRPWHWIPHAASQRAKTPVPSDDIWRRRFSKPRIWPVPLGNVSRIQVVHEEQVPVRAFPPPPDWPRAVPRPRRGKLFTQGEVVHRRPSPMPYLSFAFGKVLRKRPRQTEDDALVQVRARRYEQRLQTIWHVIVSRSTAKPAAETSIPVARRFAVPNRCWRIHPPVTEISILKRRDRMRLRWPVYNVFGRAYLEPTYLAKVLVVPVSREDRRIQ